MKVTRIFRVKKKDLVGQAKIKRMQGEGFVVIRVVDEGDRVCIHMLRVVDGEDGDVLKPVRMGVGPSEHKEVKG